MNRISILLLKFVIALTPVLVFAQENEGKNSNKLVLSGAYGMIGFSVKNQFIVTPELINKLGYSTHIEGFYSYAQYQKENQTNSHNNFRFYKNPKQNSTIYNWGIELSPKSSNNKRFNSKLRIGIQYCFNNESFQGFFTKTELLGRTVKDTLVYLVSKDTLFMYKDSMRFSNRYIWYKNDMLAFDISYIIRSNPERTISFLAGLGFAPGLIFNSTTVISGSISESSGSGYSFENLDILNSTNNKLGYSFNFYIPLGFYVKLSKRKDFWKNIYLTSEVRPSMSIQMLSDIGTHTRFFSQNMVGIRAVFN
jgi:hypothetical protein